MVWRCGETERKRLGYVATGRNVYKTTLHCACGPIIIGKPQTIFENQETTSWRISEKPQEFGKNIF